LYDRNAKNFNRRERGRGSLRKEQKGRRKSLRGGSIARRETSRVNSGVGSMEEAEVEKIR